MIPMIQEILAVYGSPVHPFSKQGVYPNWWKIMNGAVFHMIGNMQQYYLTMYYSGSDTQVYDIHVLK